MGDRMAKVISIHEYVLKPEVDELEFERAVQRAKERGLLQLPGLINLFLTKGIRGSRFGKYAAVWIYESKEAWERLWGPVGHPRAKEDYPENWKTWEDEVIGPYLGQHPDKIVFNTYEEVLV